MDNSEPTLNLSQAMNAQFLHEWRGEHSDQCMLKRETSDRKAQKNNLVTAHTATIQSLRPLVLEILASKHMVAMFSVQQCI